ncbi:hypothetical protein [Streptomyces sp. NPDC048825]|uniref:hypothetical protein n=1 Tax=Streptomyces sp. NPDC048825 TaxID=3365592 RepID=UPI0037236B5E
MRSRTAFGEAFPGIDLQPIHGDSPPANIFYGTDKYTAAWPPWAGSSAARGLCDPLDVISLKGLVMTLGMVVFDFSSRASTREP